MLRLENILSIYALVIIPIVILAYVVLKYWQKKQIAAIGDQNLIEKLSPGKANNKPLFKLLIRSFILLLLVIGLMNPQMGTKMEKVQRQGANVMVALDVSKSMMAEDIAPNRLEKAKMIISKVVDQLAGDRLGLIIYAGAAYTQVPLTSDYSAIKMFLSTINTDVLSSQGTAISEVFHLSKTAFEKESQQSQAIIILSDGEDHESGVEGALASLKDYGVTVHTVGLGTPRGGPIPISANGQDFKKDHEGNVVITQLNAEMLQQIALQSGGSYIEGSSVSQTVDHLLEQILQFEKSDLESKVITDYESQYIWFVIAAFVLIIFEFLLSNKRSDKWRKMNLFGSYE